MPEAGGLINNRDLFLTVLEAGSLRSGCRQIGCPVRPLPPAARMAVFSPCPHRVSPCAHAPLVSVSKPPVLRTPVRLDQGPPFWPPFNLITS